MTFTGEVFILCVLVASALCVSPPHYEHKMVAELFDHPLSMCERCDLSKRFCIRDCYTPIGPPGTKFEGPAPLELDDFVESSGSETNSDETGNGHIELESGMPVGPPGSASHEDGRQPFGSKRDEVAFGSGPPSFLSHGPPGTYSVARIPGAPGISTNAHTGNRRMSRSARLGHFMRHRTSPVGAPMGPASGANRAAAGPPGSMRSGNLPVGRPGSRPVGAPGQIWQPLSMLMTGQRCAADCMLRNSQCKRVHCRRTDVPWR